MTSLISLQSKGLSNITVQKHQLFGTQLSLWSNSHPYMTTGNTTALTTQTFVSKVTSLLFNMLSRFLITFLPRNKHLLMSWLQTFSTVILEPKKIQTEVWASSRRRWSTRMPGLLQPMGSQSVRHNWITEQILW